MQLLRRDSAEQNLFHSNSNQDIMLGKGSSIVNSRVSYYIPNDILKELAISDDTDRFIKSRRDVRISIKIITSTVPSNHSKSHLSFHSHEK